MTRTFALLALLGLFVCAPTAGVAVANTSHAGWPQIDGVLKMHKQDQTATMQGTRRSDELLGGHGDDVIYGHDDADVLWGDYKPGGQPATQKDRLNGGAGDDFIYASHGWNTIRAGGGDDYVKAHFGRGIVDCGSGSDTVYVSHRGRHGWKIRNCERISYKSLGY